MEKCNKTPAQKAGFRLSEILRFQPGVFEDRSEFKSILQAEETCWIVEHEMDCIERAITGFPSSTIEWE